MLNGSPSPLLSAVALGDIAAALQYGLELMGRGAVLADVDASACLANRIAMQLLRSGNGLSLASGVVVADRASDTRVLTALLREAIESGAEPTDSPLRIPRKNGLSDLIVHIAPGPALKVSPAKDGRTALMTITDPEQCVRVNEQDLTRLYGLTRGEAALAHLILQGKSVDDAANDLFISAHTARTHLKRIFLKTDTHRQPELVVRLLSAVL
jgi:DNA-binding CsgD family transcriptional regulator